MKHRPHVSLAFLIAVGAAQAAACGSSGGASSSSPDSGDDATADAPLDSGSDVVETSEGGADASDASSDTSDASVDSAPADSAPPFDGGDSGDRDGSDGDASDGGDSGGGDASDGGPPVLDSAAFETIIGVTSDDYVIYAETDQTTRVATIYAVPAWGGVPIVVFTAAPEYTSIWGKVVVGWSPPLGSPCNGTSGTLTAWASNVDATVISGNALGSSLEGAVGGAADIELWFISVDPTTCAGQLQDVGSLGNPTTVISALPGVTQDLSIRYAKDGEFIAQGTQRVDGGTQAITKLYSNSLKQQLLGTYDGPAVLDSTGRWLWVFPAAGGGELYDLSTLSVVFQDPQAQSSFVFDPVSQYGYYTGAQGVTQRLSLDGKPGAPETAEPLGLTAPYGVVPSPSGTSLYYTAAGPEAGVLNDDVYLTGNAPGAPVIPVFSFQSANYWAYTTDGNYLLELQENPTPPSPRNPGLGITAFTAPAGKSSSVSQTAVQFQLAHDSTIVAYGSGVQAIDVSGAKPPKTLVDIAIGTYAVSPDGKWFAYTSATSATGTQQLYAVQIP